MGNIFKLGTRYSEPLGATYLDEDGAERPIWMGSYGIGPARIVAAAVEQFADDQGISWPRSLAPFDVELVTLGKEGEEAREVADRLYEELRRDGLDVLYDDRDASPGEKFADAELLGCPLRLTRGQAGRRGRRGRGAGPARAGEALAGAGGGGRRPPRSCGATFPDQAPAAGHRPLGRPAARDAAAGSRCGPFTIPNLISYVRLALLPVFLVIALLVRRRPRR